MKKIISSILIISILITLVIPFNSVKAEGENIIFSLETTSTVTELVAGDVIEVNINMELLNSQQINGLDMILNYDSEILEFDTDEGFYTSRDTRWSEPTAGYEDGKIHIVSTRDSAQAAKQGLVYTIYFNVLKNASTTTISLTDITCSLVTDLFSAQGDELRIPDIGTTYTITYNSNTTDTATGMPSNGAKVEDVDYTIEAGPTRTGYTFSGWNTAADGSGTSYGAGATYSTNADLTLYAQWETVKTTLTVNPNGGVWEGSSSTQTFTEGYGTTKKINNPTTTPNGNIIRFNSNGGTLTSLQTSQTTTFSGWTGATLSGTTYTFGTTNATLTANYIGDSITLPTATKAGAEFLGWEDSNGNLIGAAGDSYTPAFTTPNATIILTAKYQEETYALTINPNGGTYIGNTTLQGTYNSTVTVNNPTKTGYTVTLDNNDGTSSTSIQQTYTFSGWTSSAGTINGTTYTFAASNATLTANYTPDVVTLPTPTKTGYTFNGWYTATTGGIKIDNPYTPTSDTTLYAQWTANTYTITFDPGTNGTVSPTNKTVTYGQTYGTLPIPTKPGYTFKGWQNSSGTLISSTDVVNITSNTTLTAEWEGETYTLTINPNGGSYNGSTSNATVTGQMGQTKSISAPTAPSGYTVTLDNNDGTGTTTQQTQTKTFDSWTVVSGDGIISGTIYTFGTEDGEIKANYTPNAITLPTPTKTGYTFNGWYTATTGGIKIDNPYTPTSDTTLYAQWTANTYTITFDPGTNGTVSPASKTVTYGQTYGTLPTATRPGYTFKEWQNSYGTTINSTHIVNITSDTTLTAIWEGEIYTLTINPNGGSYNGSTSNATLTGQMEQTKNISNPTAPNGYTITLDNNDGTGTKTQEIQTKTFDGWTVVSGDGTISGTTYTFGTEDGEIKANYTPNAVTLLTPTRPGYTFNGWYTAATGGTKVNSPYTPTLDTTLYAQWAANTYTITFDPGTNGTVSPTSKTVTYGQTYGTLPIPTKPGYSFEEWQTSNGTTINSTDIVNITSDTTLIAIWEGETYTLTINPNGGNYNGSTSNTTVTGQMGQNKTISNPTAPNGYTVTLDNNDGTGTITQEIQTKTFDSWTVVSGDGTISGTTYTFGTEDGEIKANYTPNAITLLTLTRTGYTFDGWYTAATGGTKVDSLYTPTSDTTLYAQWTPNTYTITFNTGENGTVNPTSKTVTYEQQYGTLPTPTKPGYTFKEWNNENGEKVNETDIVNITSDTTLTAIWEGTEYTITFDPDGGEVNPTNKQVTNGNEYGTLPTPTKTGHTFEGWLNVNGDKIESTTIANLTDDETLTAKWKANTYTITFAPGENGNVEEETREISYGQVYGELPAPTRQGYTFLGWYNENGEKVNENDIISSNITLTAAWEGAEYQLTFDYKGGTGNVNTKTIKNAEAYGELPEASKEGYTFLGWYDNNDNKVESINIVNTTSDITLQAKYEINTYFVTFKNDDGTEIKTIKIEHGSDAKFNGELPIKEGVAAGYEATFTGWNNAEDLKNITQDVTVTATYKVSAIIYTITYYNLKDADNSANQITYTIESEDFDLVDLQNQGKYIFKGWYTSNKEDAEKITSIDTSKLGNIVLYAQWENDELYLASEKYKVGENDIDNYEDGDIYLDKIEPETTVTELISNCDTNGIITVIDEDGNILADEDLVGTKMTIKVTRYDEQITLTAIVMGDLDGDGTVTATDLSTLNQTILYRKNLEEPRFKAADLDDNEKLTATDLSTINNTILGTINLTYSKD